MNIDQFQSDGCLKGLPMRALLNATGETAPSHASPAWVLVSSWVAQDEQPRLVSMGLRLVNLGGTTCCAVQACAIARGGGTSGEEDERVLVYLLNPAEPSVWEAIDSWRKVGTIAAQTTAGDRVGSTVSPQDMEVLEARYAEGEKLESDMLADAITRLLEAGQLEAEVAKQLDIKVQLYCTVVETPMMLKSLQPADEELWRLHKVREWKRWTSEGIWS